MWMLNDRTKKKRMPRLNQALPLLAAFAVLSTPALANANVNTGISPIANNDGSERCLVGHADTGLCINGGPDNDLYGGEKSIIALIEEDISKELGVEGKLERIHDEFDTALEFMANRPDGTGSNTGIAEMRARFAGHHIVFGLLRGENPAAADEARLQARTTQEEFREVLPFNFAQQNMGNRVWLKDCTSFTRIEAQDQGKIDSCSELRPTNQAATALDSILANGELYRPAIKVLRPWNHAEFHIYSSNPKDNLVTMPVLQPHIDAVPHQKDFYLSHLGKEKDHMVTFRFRATNAADNAKVPGILVLAFEDHESYDTGDSDYNDYVVELRYAKLKENK